MPDEGSETKPAPMRYGPIMAFWIPVLYVSIDAFLSGPGKTVLLDRYPSAYAWLSFLVVGLLVALFTVLAGAVSRSLHEKWISNNLRSPKGIALGMTFGTACEITLFSFFLIWCVTKFAEELPGEELSGVSSFYVIVAAALVGLAITLVWCKKMMSVNMFKAEAAIRQKP